MVSRTVLEYGVPTKVGEVAQLSLGIREKWNPDESRVFCRQDIDKNLVFFLNKVLPRWARQVRLEIPKEG